MLYYIIIITFLAVSNGNDTIWWRRDCAPKGEEPLGCTEHKFHDTERVVDECICDTNLCNREMGPISTTTAPTTTTTTHQGLKRCCNSCFCTVYGC